MSGQENMQSNPFFALQENIKAHIDQLAVELEAKMVALIKSSQPDKEVMIDISEAKAQLGYKDSRSVIKIALDGELPYLKTATSRYMFKQSDISIYLERRSIKKMSHQLNQLRKKLNLIIN